MSCVARVLCACCLSVTIACGSGPSSPALITEARVVTDTSWAGTLGEYGATSGPAASRVINIGSGRQCATVHRTGTGFLTLHVGSEKASDAGTGVGPSITVCGEGICKGC